MKITDLRTRIVHLDFRNCILVTIETDAGITGISETVMKRKTLTIEQSILQLKRYLVGSDPTEIEDHWEKMYPRLVLVGGPMHATAISAVDCALWDILAKSLGVPVHKLMGGPTRRAVPVYCHCPGGSTPEEFAANLKSCQERGYQAAKTTLPLFYGVKNGTEGYSGTNGAIDRCWKETEFLIPGVFRRIGEFFAAGREAVGPEFGLAVDCHGRLNLRALSGCARELEPFDLMFIEEPVPPESPEIWRGRCIVRPACRLPPASAGPPFTECARTWRNCRGHPAMRHRQLRRHDGDEEDCRAGRVVSRLDGAAQSERAGGHHDQFAVCGERSELPSTGDHRFGTIGSCGGSCCPPAAWSEEWNAGGSLRAGLWRGTERGCP